MTDGIKAIGKSSPSAEEGSDAALTIQDLSSKLLFLRQGGFIEKIDKILVYVQSANKSNDPKTLANFIRFAHLNLDAILVQALESLVFRPRTASKTDEQKRANALQKTFDRLENPEKSLLEHYESSSDPLNKYLVAGPWGHEYLKRRGIDMAALEAFDKELCGLLGCADKPEARIVLAYAGLSRAINTLFCEKRGSIKGDGQK